MNKVFLITGANLGDRKKNLQTAATSIEKRIGRILQSSAIYETEPWGNNDQPAFYNQVHIVESKLPATQILKDILEIEKQMGRVRTTKNAARIIDIDILFFNNEIINEPDLVIPHPEISNRRFVLTPLNELSPAMIHPVFQKDINTLLAACKDPLKVFPLLFS